MHVLFPLLLPCLCYVHRDAVVLDRFFGNKAVVVDICQRRLERIGRKRGGTRMKSFVDKSITGGK